MMKQSITFLAMLFLGFSISGNTQDTAKEVKADSGYVFTEVIKLPATPVKNQYRSGTCWSYSSLSFLESELLRMGKDTFDLSEMFVVYHTYADKAPLYVRFHGEHNYGGGGAAHDVTYVLKNYGIVPDEVYNGLVIGEENPVHGEMDAVLKGYIDAVLKNPNKKLSPVWQKGYTGILDAYLGEIPESFTYQDVEYTPKSFADMLGLNPDDYIEIGSYTHHPFYEKFILEVPDNWLMDEIYNVHLDEMMEILDNSLKKGYTVVWGSDISDKGFSWKNGVAIVPDKDAPELAGLEQAKWEKMTDKEKEELLYKFKSPVPEKEITQEMRQNEFDNYQSTDDHGMHIIGMAKDQNGSVYYIVKNSWGIGTHKYDGYFYASKPFVELKTMDIMVHKDIIPKDIRKKLGL
ncbi:MAG: aminopeptidase [Bacteroidales bacterium]|nr:aminopeptidase [Bacteroidales bacterium]